MTVKTRTFCCCIPTRVGVIIISLIGLLGGGSLAVGGILKARTIQGSKAPIAIAITIYVLLAIVSLFGLIGALARKLVLVKAYFGALFAHLLLSFALGVYALFRVFRDRRFFVQSCIVANSDVKNPATVCAQGLRVVRGVSVVLFIVVCSFEIYACMVVRGYSDQLQDEKVHEGLVGDREVW